MCMQGISQCARKALVNVYTRQFTIYIPGSRQCVYQAVDNMYAKQYTKLWQVSVLGMCHAGRSNTVRLAHP